MSLSPSIEVIDALYETAKEHLQDEFWDRYSREMTDAERACWLSDDSIADRARWIAEEC